MTSNIPSKGREEPRQRELTLKTSQSAPSMSTFMKYGTPNAVVDGSFPTPPPAEILHDGANWCGTRAGSYGPGMAVNE